VEDISLFSGFNFLFVCVIFVVLVFCVSWYFVVLVSASCRFASCCHVMSLANYSRAAEA